MFFHFQFDGETILAECNHLTAGLPVLLCLHGIGDCAQVFQEIIYSSDFDKYNVIAPDYIGFGVNSHIFKSDYSFSMQILYLKTLLAVLACKDIYILGHSIGGDVGTYLCADSDITGSIRKFVCVESDITQYDDFMTTQAYASAQNGLYDEWFSSFRTNVVARDWTNEAGCRYYRSLLKCNPLAFRQMILELYTIKRKIDGDFSSEVGHLYLSIRTPRIFCYGESSIDKKSLEFLRRNNIVSLGFEDAGHWIMIDQKKEFSKFLCKYLED